MSDANADEEYRDEVPYRRPEEITAFELMSGLGRLALFDDDPMLRMQAFNLANVDEFVTQLEYQVLQQLHEKEATPVPEAAFLLALSQMWIFAAYELMRTWRQLAKDIVKWHENGGLTAKIQSLEADIGYLHFGRQSRAEQIKMVLVDPTLVDRIRLDLRLSHIPFARLEAIRVSLAKHEVRGRSNSVALSPGYGRINRWCGSLDFELENGIYSMGTISRRDIADEICSLGRIDAPPTDEDIKSFEAYMRGKEME